MKNLTSLTTTELEALLRATQQESDQQRKAISLLNLKAFFRWQAAELRLKLIDDEIWSRQFWVWWAQNMATHRTQLDRFEPPFDDDEDDDEDDDGETYLRR